MEFGRSALVALTLCTLSAAQDAVRVTGRLLDENLAPVAGASLSLLGAGLSATSATNGTFDLSNQGAVLPHSRTSDDRSWRMKGRDIELLVSADGTPVRAEFFNLRGARVGVSIDARLPAGEYRISPRRVWPVSGAGVLRVDVGTERWSLLYAAGGSRAPQRGVARQGSLTDGRATLVATDSLHITRDGYASALVMTEAAVTDLGDIILSGTNGYPRIMLMKGSLRIMAYTPDPDNGYYRGCRFDWSGMVGRAWFNGHTFFADWKTSHNPLDNEAAIGPAEEFGMDSALGYYEAGSGESFIKIGVGVLRRSGTGAYSFSNSYAITDTGDWSVRRGAAWIEYRHDIPTVRTTGYSYVKRLRLSGDTLLIEHVLRNTGTGVLRTPVYSHNFTIIDDVDIGVPYKVTLGFSPTIAEGTLGTYATRSGAVVDITRTISDSSPLWVVFRGYTTAAADNRSLVENTTNAASVAYIGDRPLVRYQLWAKTHALCPEPSIALTAAAGDSVSWTNRVLFAGVAP